ncbi:MAG: nuclear transport factor 2 family protein [Eudoraea sp.]|nr:nuclear transport factor 2 family protein [Eudoraea sp.]
MKIIKMIFALLFLFNLSCKNNSETLEVDSFSNDNKAQFDVAKATVIIEKRCKEFEDAIKIGDSIAVGDLYTVDTKIIPSHIGRNSIITEVHEMFRDSITEMSFKIINLWGNDNIIVEDAFVEFYHANGTLVSKGNALLVWKKEEDTWRIFRDVYKAEKK